MLLTLTTFWLRLDATDPASINTINTLMLIGFSILSSTLTGVLKQVHYPSWGNDMIVFLVAILCMVLYVWVDSLLTGSASLLFGSVLGVGVVVMSRFDPLQKWTNYLQAAVKLGGPDSLTQTREPSPLILPASLIRSQDASTPTEPIITRGNTPAPTSLSNGASVPSAEVFKIPTVPLTKLPPSLPDEHVEPPAGA